MSVGAGDKGENGKFLGILVVFTWCLYWNTFSSGYVWDDRAAIVSNQDVQRTPIWEIFSHDFWGQDIMHVASHKSYRPLTVLSYRVNYLWAELDPYWFHVGNVLIYIATVCMFYLAAKRWISVDGSRIGALLFAAHPVHCEAVSSLVGRADCLSGLFFVSALILYSDGLGRLRIQSKKSSMSSFRNTAVTWSYFLLAHVSGFAACLSKEIGLTIFGLFVVFEVIYVSSLSHKLPQHFLRNEVELSREIEMSAADKEKVLMYEECHRWVFWINKREVSHNKPLSFYIKEELLILKNNLSFSYLLSMVLSTPAVIVSTLNYLQNIWIPQQEIRLKNCDDEVVMQSPLSSIIRLKDKNHKSFRDCILWFTKFPSGVYLRIGLHVVSLVSVLIFRSHLHGDTQLYSWTIMENSISLESSFVTRVLSYAHTHYMMLLKLLNPITPHLCFDYGHYCLPIVRSAFEAINILSLGTYCAIIYWILDALLLARRTTLFGLLFFLLPLVPALNILFPVGTTLAERLLFVPSMGISLLVGEYFAHSLSYVWEPVGAHWASIASRSKLIKSHTVSSPMTLNAFAKMVMYVTLVPILLVMAFRVVDRNTEWKDEFSIYNSALQVCPNNYKALTNTGMLLLNKDKKSNAADAAALSDRALEVYDAHPTAFLNSALSHAANKKFFRAMYRYKQAEKLENVTNFKQLYQYMGGTLNDYVDHINSQSSRGPVKSFLPPSPDGTPYADEAVVQSWWNAVGLLNADAGAFLDQSIKLGMDKPIAMFSRAAISINIGTPDEYQRAIDLLGQVIIRNSELMLLRSQGVPVEDTISIENAYNQRALAFMNLERYKEAEEHFILAIDSNPMLWQAYINLATMYFDVNQPQKAKEMLVIGSKVYHQAVAGPLHLSFMIQLGFAEELMHNYQTAYEHYEQGMQLVEEFKRTGYPYDQSHAVKLINNLNNLSEFLKSK